ncbi:hypothetical protein N7517_004691 [Penicillium concentricum]|uniref:Uncharacterized protein n=1 Tax=Penicillium concentricum TaxID=293559 RepID=A0A9W9VAS1_9EURO|nr:uncharacterized protein N7517_004691 [Penicillium concentricum]KAJ5372685.1 hypothetical protein N7517_004691 [Penicillium concentricum]
MARTPGLMNATRDSLLFTGLPGLAIQPLLSSGSRADSTPEGIPGKQTPPLHVCLMTRDDLGVVQVLLGAGASVSAQRVDGRSALHLASNHPPQLAMMLIQAGADVNARSENGCTPFHDAATAGNLGVIELLLEITPGWM